MHTGCARPAGSSRLASGTPPPVARARVLPSQSCDLIEVTAPNGFRLPLVAGIWVYPACLPTLERRDVRGRPRWQGRVTRSAALQVRATDVQCAPQQTGRGHALRLVRLAARQLTAVAQPLQGPVASARSRVPLRMRAITTGISHLQCRSFLGPPSASDSARCVRLRRRIHDALH
jgi:hypothetical protein